MTEPAPPCPCGVVGPPPWRTHDGPWSPASVVGAAIVAAVLVLAATMTPGPRAAIAAAVVGGVVVVAALVAAVVLGRRGHRGGCRLGRATWIGVATVGLPFRVLAFLNV